MTTNAHDDRDQKMTTLLEVLGPEDPPDGFTQSVLTKISATCVESAPAPTPARVIRFSNGGFAMTVTKKAMWGLAAAAAVILAVFVTRGFPPVDRGTEGAIGAAKKYQAPQLTDKDVITGDAAAQEFLQSETFDQLIKDPEAVALLSDAEFRNALHDQGFADAMRQSEIRANLRNGLLQRIFDDQAARAALEDALKVQMVSKASDAAVRGVDVKASLSRLDARIELRPSARADLRTALEDASLVRSLQSDALRGALARAEVRSLLQRNNIAAALGNASFAKAVNARGFDAAARSSRFENALSNR